MSEKMRTLLYTVTGATERKAEWGYIEQLYSFENNPQHVSEVTGKTKLRVTKVDHITSQSVLTVQGICPRPIELQKVSYALQVFNAKTLCALKGGGFRKYLENKRDSRYTLKGLDETAEFIEIVVRWWQIVNNKETGVYQRGGIKEIRTQDDNKLEELNNFSIMAPGMYVGVGTARIGGLTLDTSRAIVQTCRGLIALTRDLLLNERFEYVLLGHFTTDPLERAFGKLRQGSGGAYHITVQQVLEKLRIHHAKKVAVALKSDPDILSGIEYKHVCDGCTAFNLHKSRRALDIF